MKQNTKIGGCSLVLFLAAALLSGCSDSGKSNGEKGSAATAKPHVDVLLGKDNYDKAAPKLAKGKKATFKGELGNIKGNKVVVHVADLYTGDEPAIKAADLTKDFLADAAAAKKKYNPEGKFSTTIIVEGVISELLPTNYRIILKGHE